MTREEIEAKLAALKWTLDGPRQTVYGFKASIQRGSVTIIVTGSTEIGVLEDLLRDAEKRAGRQP